MRTFLNLCFYWGELYIIMENYLLFNKGESTESTLNDLFSHIGDKEWGLISERVNNFGGKPCKTIMVSFIGLIQYIYFFNYRISNIFFL